jgi:hypothetical protein
LPGSTGGRITLFDLEKLNAGQTIGVFNYDEAKKIWSEVHGGKIDQIRISIGTDQLAKVYAALIIDQPIGSSTVGNPQGVFIFKAK